MIGIAKFRVKDGVLERRIYYLNQSMVDDSLAIAHEGICREYSYDLDDVKLVDLELLG